MTRLDVYEAFAEFIFDITPSGKEADQLVSAEDVESMRLRAVAICDLLALRVADDAEHTPEDEADMCQQIEADEREEVRRG